MTIDIRALARKLIILALVLTPFVSIGDVLALFGGSIRSQVIASTPVYLKLVKDVLMVALVALGIARLARSGRTNVLATPFLILLLYTLIAASLASDSPTLALAGLRWILPVFVAFFLYEFVDDLLMQRIARTLAALLFVHFGLQVVELFYMSHWYGANVLGLAARVPGFFLIPSTAGFFAVVTLYFVHFYGTSLRQRWAIYCVAPVSVFLTQSGTGLIATAAVAALIALGIRRVWLIIPLGGLAAGVIVPLLPVITGRQADYVTVSGGTRVQIFADLFRHIELVPTAFGYVTNTAVSLFANGGASLRSDVIPTIVDSTYASIVGNLGIGGTVFFAIFCATWAIVVVCSRRLDLYVATAIFSLYGFTTIIFEAYPMNVLLSVCAAYFLRATYVPFWSGRQNAALSLPSRISSRIPV